jgi:hypothetical protein
MMHLHPRPGRFEHLASGLHVCDGATTCQRPTDLSSNILQDRCRLAVVDRPRADLGSSYCLAKFSVRPLVDCFKLSTSFTHLSAQAGLSLVRPL